jgi:hypothetical protein
MRDAASAVEFRDAAPSRMTVAATLIGVAAAVGIAYRCDRAYARWLRETRPLAGTRARLDRARTGLRASRANVSEMAEVIADVLIEVERARSTR